MWSITADQLEKIPNFKAFDAIFQAQADRYLGGKLPWWKLKAQSIAESRLDPSAVNVRSGATGLAQITVETALWLGFTAKDRLDPAKNVAMQASLMGYLMGTNLSPTGVFRPFLNAHNGERWLLSLAGYDWGWGYVAEACQKTGVWTWDSLRAQEGVPAETTNYVGEIQAYAALLETLYAS